MFWHPRHLPVCSSIATSRPGARHQGSFFPGCYFALFPCSLYSSTPVPLLLFLLRGNVESTPPSCMPWGHLRPLFFFRFWRCLSGKTRSVLLLTRYLLSCLWP